MVPGVPCLFFNGCSKSGIFRQACAYIVRSKTSQSYAYNRLVDNSLLSFKNLDGKHIVDDETGSIWQIRMENAYLVLMQENCYRQQLLQMKLVPLSRHFGTCFSYDCDMAKV